jgi:hypothetical protein
MILSLLLALAGAVQPAIVEVPQADSIECVVVRSSDVSYPPLDLKVLSQFQPSMDHAIVSHRNPPTQYRTYAALLVKFDGSGKASSASFSVSTGNGPVDKALQAWALGISLPESACLTRKIQVPVDLRGQQGEP